MALAVLVHGGATLSAPGLIASALAGTLLIVAAGLGLYINMPRDNAVTRCQNLKAMVGERWTDAPDLALRAVANETVTVIVHMRRVSKRRTSLLALALGLQMAAVMLLLGVLVEEMLARFA